MPRELFNYVTIDGDQFAIKKFDAMTGLSIARLLIAKAAPLISSFAKDDLTQDDTFDLFVKLISEVTDDDLHSVVDKCLRVCYKVLPAGHQAVIDANGNYGIEDIEYDLMLTLRLCFEAIKWGASDFFGEKRLDSSWLTNLGLKQPKRRTTTATSIRPS